MAVYPKQLSSQQQRYQQQNHKERRRRENRAPLQKLKARKKNESTGGRGGGDIMFCLGGSTADGTQKSNRPFPYIAAGMLPVLSMPEITLPPGKKKREQQENMSDSLKESLSHPASYPHGNFIGGMRLSRLAELEKTKDPVKS